MAAAHLRHPHLRVPDERARLVAHRRPARGRRPGRGRASRGRGRRRAQHLLHPGERRQQALRHPRPPEVAQGAAPGPRDRGRRLPRPEGPRPGARAGAPRRRGARHPQRAPGRRAAARGPRRAARSPRSSRPPRRPTTSSSRPPSPPGTSTGYAAWVTIQIGCDNSCAFCIVPAVRGPEISKPVRPSWSTRCGSLADEGVTEVTLLGQNVNSYGRDLALAQRRAGEEVRVRPLFADLLRAVGAVDGHRAGALHQPAPEGPRHRRGRGDGRDRRRCASTSTCRCRRGATACSPPCTGATPPSATSRGSARPGPAWPTWPSPPTSSWASPARPTTTSSAPSRWSAEAGYDSAYTFIYSPRPGTEAAERPDEFVPAEVAAERFARLTAVVERSARLRHEARVGRVEEVVVEGRSRRDPAEAHRPDPPEQARPLPGGARCGPGTYATVRVTDAGAAPPAGRAGRASPPRRGTAPASRSRPGRNPSAWPRGRPSRRRRRSWRRPASGSCTSSARGSASWPRSGPTVARGSTRSARWWPTASCGRSSSGSSPKCRDLERDGRYALHSFPPVEKDDEFAVTGPSDGSTTPRARSRVMDGHERPGR